MTEEPEGRTVMTVDEAKASLDLLFSGVPEVGNDRIRIWTPEVAVGEACWHVSAFMKDGKLTDEVSAYLRVTLKSGHTFYVTEPLRGTK
jgi:hypothetical protein